MVLQVCFISGQVVPVDLADAVTLGDVRLRVAEVLNAPSPANVELLAEDGQRLEDEVQIASLGDAKLQTYMFGLPDPEEEESQRAEQLRGEQEDEDPFFADYEKMIESKTEAKTEANKPVGEYSVLRHRLKSTSSDTEPSALGAFPLHEAVNQGSLEGVVLLLTQGDRDISEKDTAGDTALHRAAYHSSAEIVEVLLGSRADPNISDRKGKTALRRAYDNEDVAKLLLAADADPNVSDKDGTTALHRAAEDGNLNVITALVEARADISSYSDDELTAFHTAAIFGQSGVIEYLLSARADINSKSAGGNTALHLAAYGGRREVGLVLLKAGADSKIQNDDGETPKKHAENAGQEALEWLD
eukprot:CAMPEP_0169092070 /NCGR_PEP_ID=MMETSP1015-20121227/16710_1 /TAXON_ID=342587 /ORGANISM="Karlodinium micrum, Strain CCMP2283" /LENGTH=358 /DNA_ID=CAMNT_0009152625 /DNA_START=27 /DNA_END=1106 /DNA_ORIENTATION=-